VVNADGISVTDNGGGIAPDDVTRMLDYTQRVSSNEAHASPTRGRQGNAIQTVLAMPFVLDGKRGQTTIESRGVRHTIVFEIDPVRQTPKLSTVRVKGGFVHSGTRITVQWPFCASSKLKQTRSRIVHSVVGYAMLNPHLTISLEWPGHDATDIAAFDPRWHKWVPGDLTSAHWYDQERFNRLIAGTVANDQDNGRDTLVREFIAENFRGMARSDMQKQVLNRIGAARMSLAGLFAEGKNRKAVAALLKALQDITKPMKPVEVSVGRLA
jgi:DNA topoisomerase VI subunit B